MPALSYVNLVRAVNDEDGPLATKLSAAPYFDNDGSRLQQVQNEGHRCLQVEDFNQLADDPALVAQKCAYHLIDGGHDRAQRQRGGA